LIVLKRFLMFQIKEVRMNQKSEFLPVELTKHFEKSHGQTPRKMLKVNNQQVKRINRRENL